MRCSFLMLLLRQPRRSRIIAAAALFGQPCEAGEEVPERPATPLGVLRTSLQVAANYSQAKKEVIQLEMFSEEKSINKSIASQLRTSPEISFYLDREMSTFWGPCFCLLSSCVLGQVQVRQVGSRSRANKTHDVNQKILFQ